MAEIWVLVRCLPLHGVIFLITCRLGQVRDAFSSSTKRALTIKRATASLRRLSIGIAGCPSLW